MMMLNVDDVMAITVDESAVIPTTPAQVQAFTTWATSIYRNYANYKESIHSPVIDEYIRTHILTEEMKIVMRVSERRNAAATFNALGANRFLTYRSRVIKKIKYMKEKLGKLAFREEYRETLRQARTARRDARATVTREHIVEYYNIHDPHVRIVFLQMANAHLLQARPAAQPFAHTKKVEIVTEDFANTEMGENCAICMDLHKMSEVCVTKCGHQFGTKCLSSWNKPACPLCRTYCTEITEYKVSETIDLV